MIAPAMMFAQRLTRYFNTHDRTIIANGISIRITALNKKTCVT